MGRAGSYCKVAMDFNRKHGKNITHDTVAKFTEVKKTASVTDQPRSSCPRTATDEGTTDTVLGAFAKSPHKSTGRLAAESSVSRQSITHILKNHKWHPYKMQLLQHFSEDESDRWVEFCIWVVNKLNYPTSVFSL
jgi:hypothetical protein